MKVIRNKKIIAEEKLEATTETCDVTVTGNYGGKKLESVTDTGHHDRNQLESLPQVTRDFFTFLFFLAFASAIFLTGLALISFILAL